MEELIPPGITPQSPGLRRMSLAEAERAAAPQQGPFHMDWSSKDRVLWPQSKLKAVAEAEKGLAEARAAARRASREHELAAVSLRQLKGCTVTVARVRFQREAATRFDVPLDGCDTVELSGKLWSACPEGFTLLEREECQGWQDELERLRGAVADRERAAAAAKAAFESAESELRSAEQRLRAAKG